MRGNCHKLCQGRFRFDIRKIFSQEGLEQAAEGNGGVTTPEVFRRCVDVVLKDMAWQCWVMVGLNDLKSLFQLNDSMI